MDDLRRVYLPMTESMFYILLSLSSPRHGYAIILHVRNITKGRISLTAGTVYNSLSRLLEDGLISLMEAGERRKTYSITERGLEILRSEIARLRELVENSAQELP